MMQRQTATISPSWRLFVQVGLWRHGWIWLVIMLLLLLALLMQQLWLPSLNRSAQQAQALIRQLEDQQVAQRNTPVATPTLTADDLALQALDRATYAESQITPTLRAIYAIAAKQGITVAQSEFQTNNEGRGGLRQLQVTLPMRTNYPQFKAFTQELLRQHAGISLDQLQIKRESITQKQPEVRIKLSLWIDPRKSGSKATNKALSVTSSTKDKTNNDQGNAS
jgi:hypothetical protein